MILYPTETLYALGVNALDPAELALLYEIKGRDASKVASWLVRDIADIERWGVVSEKAEKIINRFLPGPLTLVLQTQSEVPRECVASDGTIGFRISSDPIAQSIIMAYMEEHEAPLTCTSAT
jgi:L-threonylcarbamoyladenylate synthase